MLKTSVVLVDFCGMLGRDDWVSSLYKLGILYSELKVRSVQKSSQVVPAPR